MSAWSTILRSIAIAALLGAVGWFAWRSYQEPLRGAARDYLAFRRVQKHEEILRQAARESGVDPHLLAALMMAESGGRVDVVSRTGAMGLFQLTRTTAEWRAHELGLPSPSDEELRSDALLNARLGANNLAWLLRTYDGDELRAVCAYNAGARKLKDLCEAEGGWEAWRDARLQNKSSTILAYGLKVLGYRDELVERGAFRDES